MADVETPAAESSPAAEPPKAAPAQAPADDSGPLEVPSDPEAYAEWRQTGKLPGRKPSKREESASSRISGDGDEPSESAPGSEPGSQAGKWSRNAQRRFDKIVAEREAFREEVEALKAQQATAAKQDAKPPESSSAAPAPPSPEAPKKPRQENFQTWDAYEQALDEYNKASIRYEFEAKWREKEQQQQHKASEQAMQAKLNEATVRYGAEAEPKIYKTAATLFEDKQIHPDLKYAVTRSDVLVDALYVMGSYQDDFAKFLDLAKKDPLQAIYQWWTVENLVRQELAQTQPPETSETPPRAPDGRFQPARMRSAPAPPTELSGNSAPPGDELDRAAKNNDVRAFFAEANRRDFARWKGQA